MPKTIVWPAIGPIVLSPGDRNVPLIQNATMIATMISPAPATTDSPRPATRGTRVVVSRPTARSRTDGSATRAMKRKTIGRTAVSSAPTPWGSVRRVL